MDLLRGDVQLDDSDRSSSNYGRAYDNRKNVANDTFRSQLAAQLRCKQYAVKCGFQFFVKCKSTEPNNSGNAKYCCKKLHGQQFFDATTPFSKLQCPLFLNVSGDNGSCKL
ncbi:hypothetical protein PC116_g27009 [Phytophthora cactorum]|nr:hypothetical protein PC114_g25351 [Phytophthora cactorum]KAG3126347.1 hypothetical protein C6341_g25404 [Phytophthora cactorum]KAG4224539.1 hypothetical protein PC116_g27009 [Phytophthora cactorum]